MKFQQIDPPRVFDVGRGARIQLKDCARIALQANEQVTFTTETGGEYDVVRKDWGFYATPSLNGRLRDFKMRAALVSSPSGKYYIFVLEQGKEPAFEEYLRIEKHRVVCWLDSDENLNALAKAVEQRCTQ
jgi:hypothetical protein